MGRVTTCCAVGAGFVGLTGGFVPTAWAPARVESIVIGRKSIEAAVSRRFDDFDFPGAVCVEAADFLRFFMESPRCGFRQDERRLRGATIVPRHFGEPQRHA
jgi:hypothetical protein